MADETQVQNTPADTTEVVVTAQVKHPSVVSSTINAVTHPSSFVRRVTGREALEHAGGGDLGKSSARVVSTMETAGSIGKTESGLVKLSNKFSEAAHGVGKTISKIPGVDFVAGADEVESGVSSAEKISGAVKDGAGSVAIEVTNAAGDRVGPAGTIVGAAVGISDAKRDLPNLMNGIKEMSARNVPGFVYAENEHGKVWADCSAQVENPNAQCWAVYDDGKGNSPKLIGQKPPTGDLGDLYDAAKNKAGADVAEFKMDHESKNTNGTTVAGAYNQVRNDATTDVLAKAQAAALPQPTQHIAAHFSMDAG